MQVNKNSPPYYLGGLVHKAVIVNLRLVDYLNLLRALIISALGLSFSKHFPIKKFLILFNHFFIICF